MITPISTLSYDTDPLPTIETWDNFYEENIGSDPAFMYVDATFDMLKKIETVLLIENYQELKSRLTDIYEERHSFVKHAISNTP